MGHREGVVVQLGGHTWGGPWICSPRVPGVPLKVSMSWESNRPGSPPAHHGVRGGLGRVGSTPPPRPAASRCAAPDCPRQEP